MRNISPRSFWSFAWLVQFHNLFYYIRQTRHIIYFTSTSDTVNMCPHFMKANSSFLYMHILHSSQSVEKRNISSFPNFLVFGIVFHSFSFPHFAPFFNISKGPTNYLHTFLVHFFLPEAFIFILFCCLSIFLKTATFFLHYRLSYST